MKVKLLWSSQLAIIPTEVGPRAFGNEKSLKHLPPMKTSLGLNPCCWVCFQKLLKSFA